MSKVRKGIAVNGRLLGEEGRELAYKALEFMETHNVPPTAENYAVWSSYVSGSTPELCESVQKILDSGAEFTDEVSAGLFAEFYHWKSIQDAVLESGGQMGRELGAVKETLQAAERDTAAYGEALAGATSELEKGSDPGMKKMVETLVSATATMQKRSKALEARLAKTHEEIDQLRSNLERVREEAMTDALTGVANRKRFDETLRRVRRGSENEGKPFSLVLCDIDFFKRFNDTWGHQTGDQIIRFVAGCLTRHAGENDLVARYGGEEFGIVLAEADSTRAEKIAENVRRTVESKKLLRKSTNEDLGNITVSLGVAEYAGKESVEELIERADTALYRSKQNGRNRVTTDDCAQARDAAA
jgi:diguanylate cyclase